MQTQWTPHSRSTSLDAAALLMEADDDTSAAAGGRLLYATVRPASDAAAPLIEADTVAAAGGRSLCAAYDEALARRPLVVKALTSGVLYGAGDALAQCIEMRTGASDRYDGARCVRAVAYGGVFYPPVAHAHFEFLEWLVVARWQTPETWMPWVKMYFTRAAHDAQVPVLQCVSAPLKSLHRVCCRFLEQFVYWSYFSNIYYHVVLGALQGLSLRRVRRRVRERLWDTLKAQWAFWVPAQLVNFRLVPVRHQLNFVLVVSLVWTTFLSLTFPPQSHGHARRGVTPAVDRSPVPRTWAYRLTNGTLTEVQTGTASL